ncbi:hypothetical protein KFE94_00645 [bacterium SCSIO 12643]|nr:hypothetical protein KFE94_00645 [bacterium SCSIO 12643]
MKLSDIDQSRLKFPLLRKLLQDQMDAGVVSFKDLKSTIPKDSNFDQHGLVQDEFIASAGITEVFDHYIQADPNIAWNSGGWVSFGLALNKNSGEVYYPGDDFPGAQVGQVYYIHLVILGLKKLCMSQEIVKIDRENFQIVFSYIENGMTAGIQEIQFEPHSSGQTKVIHSSYFKGVSTFRDKFYPYFHSMIVSKFHENVIRSLTKS